MYLFVKPSLYFQEPKSIYLNYCAEHCNCAGNETTVNHNGCFLKRFMCFMFDWLLLSNRLLLTKMFSRLLQVGLLTESMPSVCDFLKGLVLSKSAMLKYFVLLLSFSYAILFAGLIFQGWGAISFIKSCLVYWAELANEHEGKI